ncbi:MAG: ribonuclease H family protein [Muribaculaceae bacterium]|nr:ribonuclease H family protein [Muribaculaceae bacterium]
MAEKYYAVRKGKTPGVYRTWEECRNQVHGFPGAVYKSFPTQAEAAAFVSPAALEDAGRDAIAAVPDTEAVPAGDAGTDYAFVDGSYNDKSRVYGYGGFLVSDGRRYVLQGCGKDPELAGMRNVAGEVAGSMAAMEKALELGMKALTIYYDYMGIEMWATGAWKRNKRGTKEYYDFVQGIRKKLAISFVKVKGHAGIEGNEEADRLAKEAVGIESKR